MNVWAFPPHPGEYCLNGPSPFIRLGEVGEVQGAGKAEKVPIQVEGS